MRMDVLIIGAGPTGLSAACELARYGIPFKIIDRHRDLSDQSKALGMQARTLEIFDRWGLGDHVAASGAQAQSISLIFEGKERARLELGRLGEGLTRYPYMLIIPQPVTEELLEERLAAYHGAVQWDTELVGLRAFDDKVEAGVETPDGKETWQARYVIAADGARSFVRKALKIPFEGGTYENQFFLADCDIEWNCPPQELVLIPHPNGILAFFPMGEKKYRVIGTLSAQYSDKEEISFDEIKAEVALRAGIPIKLENCTWSSIYRLHHRCIEQFRVGSVFFAGDAAHVHSPAGAQGMNTGIQDAVNIAWKMAYVLKGWAMPEILNSYHKERHPFAERLVKSTDLGFKVMASPRRWALFTRRFLVPHLLPRVWKSPELRKEIFRFISQIATRYGESPLSQEEGEIMPAGARVPDFPLPFGIRLYEALRDGKWLLLYWGENEVALESSREHIIHAIHVTADTLAPAAKKPVKPSGAILVRPDGYVGLQMQPYSHHVLDDYLTRWLCS